MVALSAGALLASAPATLGRDGPVEAPTTVTRPRLGPPAAAIVGDSIRELIHSRARTVEADAVEQIALAVLSSSDQVGVDPLLLIALIEVESSYQADAFSSGGAMGLMQVVPVTGAWVAMREAVDWEGPGALFNPDTNVEIGSRYFAQLVARFQSLPTALAAYNVGPKKVAEILAGGRLPNSSFADRVMTVYRELRHAWGERDALAHLGGLWLIEG